MGLDRTYHGHRFILVRFSFNPLMLILKPQSNEPLYCNTVIGTLAVDGRAVTFVTARPSTASAATSYYLM